MRTVLPPKAKLIPKQAKLVFEGVVYSVYQWPQKMYDGSYRTFEMIKRPDTVNVIAVKDSQIVVLDQQQPTKPRFYSIPGGRHDDADEDELAAVQRETLEETGMTFSDWKLLEIIQPSSTDEHFVYIFLATGFERQQAQQLGAGEKIRVRLVSFDAFMKLADDPKAQHLPKDILETAGSLGGLLALPAYKGAKP